MKTPTIHLNGTSREALLESHQNAYEAVFRALLVLNDAAPNARDYYVQGDRAFQDAQSEHIARCQKLRDVRDEIEFLMNAIIDT